MKYFGTDGIRGKFGEFPITEKFFRHLGVSIRTTFPNLKKIILGCDTRYSCELLLQALLEGLSNDIHIVNLGIVSSPILSQTVVFCHADLGLMITASHNPAHDNGIKLFNHNGDKISIGTEELIESNIDFELEHEVDIITQHLQKDVHGFYDKFNKFYPYKVVIDTANGSSAQFAKKTYQFKEIFWIGDQPNGYNINHNCGSEYPQDLARKVLDVGADFGIAHDGDGDRALLCDRFGHLVPGEALLGILALDFKKRNLLKNNTIVTTPVSNVGLEFVLKKYGIKTIYSNVGDRNVADTMKSNECNLGGESSGHIIIKDFAPTSDGILTVLCFLEALERLNLSITEAKELIPLYPQKKCNMPVKYKVPLNELGEAWTNMQMYEKNLGSDGKILVRYSGTESTLRVVVEAKTEDLTDLYFQKVKKTLENCDKII